MPARSATPSAQASDVAMVISQWIGNLAREHDRQLMLAKRRVDVRYTVDLPVKVATQVPALGRAAVYDLKAWLLDASYSGIGLLTDKPLAVGAVILLLVPGLAGPANGFRTKVVRAEPLVGTLHRAGGVFLTD